MKKIIQKTEGNPPDLQPIKCPCEKGFHTVDLKKPEWREVIALIQQFGEVIEVEYLPTNQIFIIPRFYIAVHGLKGKELPELGFPTKEGSR